MAREAFHYFDACGRERVFTGKPARRGFPGARRANWGFFQGATASPSRSVLPGVATDAGRELTPGVRRELMRKARFMKRNSGLVRAVSIKLRNYAVGGGIFPVLASSDERWNEASWEWFNDLAQVADVRGRLSFWESQRARADAKFYDGDVFTVLTATRGNEPRFQLVKAHACGNWEIGAEENWVDGVRLGRLGRPTGYRFKLAGADAGSRTLPARSVIHSAMLEEFDQVRGVTALAHALNDAQDVHETLALEKKAVKDHASIGRVHRTGSGEDENPESLHFGADNVLSETSEEQGGIPVEKVYDGAEIVQIGSADAVELLSSDRPSTAFVGFLDWLGRQITAGCGFPYEFAWNPGRITGPGMRAVLDQVKSCVRDWQRAEERDSAKFRTYAISKAIENGDLRDPPPDWWRCEWLPTAPDPTIDRQDADKIANMIKAG